jgi:hypothetical protein
MGFSARGLRGLIYLLTSLKAGSMLDSPSFSRPRVFPQRLSPVLYRIKREAISSKKTACHGKKWQATRLEAAPLLLMQKARIHSFLRSKAFFRRLQRAKRMRIKGQFLLQRILCRQRVMTLSPRPGHFKYCLPVPR